MSMPPQMSPEDLIMQAAGHIRSQDVHMDSSMSAPMAHQMAYQQHQQGQPHPQDLHRHPLPVEQFAGNGSFTEGDTSMMDREDNPEGDSINNELSQPRSGSLRSSANNELEMRQLFSANRHRELRDVAGELHGNERGPNSERTRQVFAMLWINTVCSTGKGSVPRGRVYANYASRCATERITVLNPASFGKLVRVLFPGLKTRRLGVRGESKYHYVNFALVDDQPDARDSQPPPPPRLLSEPRSHASQSFQSQSAANNSKPAASAPPSQPTPLLQEPARHASHATATQRMHGLYNTPDLTDMSALDATMTKTILELAFMSPAEENVEQSETLALPPIEQYLPPGTDPDAAKSLSALYRSHCTSLVECIRYCKEKTFFHLYTSFQGTLTMPVHKLFSNPALSPWIEGCDLVLYQSMMRIISKLTLQVLPKAVLDTLRAISERLVPHIRESFQGQPSYVLRAKETPATLFASLLDRALRVNLTAHAAANMLSNPANRDQMYMEWITMIKPRKLAACVPMKGMDDTVALLIGEIRDLLDPQDVPWEFECLTIYGDVAVRVPKTSGPDNGANSTGNVLDKWVNLLQSLKERFPYASPADIVNYVDRIGTAVMRDITLSSGKSFGSWWVTKTWMDEMVSFLAEQGGFMKRTVSVAAPEQVVEEAAATKVNARQQSSRYSSGSDELNLPNMSQSQPGRAPFPPLSKSKDAPLGVGSGADLHDDSGIGIRTPDDEFTVEKFTFSPPASDHMGLGREASQGVA